MADQSRSKQSPEAQAYLAAIVESSDDAIISKDLQGTITSWNKAAERIFGYSAQEAIGQSILMLIPPERASEETEILSKIRRGERIEHFETVRVRKDGQTIPISATISPIKDSRGKIIGASKIGRDISDRILAEERVHKERERLRVTLASIGDAVIVTNAEGQVRFLNPVAESLTGWTQQEGEGQPLEAVFKIIHETTRRPAENPANR